MRRYNRLTAGIMAAAIIISSMEGNSVFAQSMLTEESTTTEESGAVEEYLNQELVADDEAAQQLRGILYNCTEYGLRSQAGGDEIVVTMYSGQQLFLKTLVIRQDGSKWYEVTVNVEGVTYNGYISAEYVLCNDSENLEELLVRNETVAASGQSAEETTPEIIENTELVSQSMNADFEASIASFPESYKEYLRTLHEKHPSWVFVPQITNIDWDTFIDAEMVKERNLVPRSMDDAYKGKQEWAYNPETGEYYGLSGYGWVQASQAAVEYYADPRNFLTEDSIFQFELLTYNSEYQTEEGVEAIINGTFMSHCVMADDVVTYAKAFCLAGEQTNVSPYMLAARVRQEQGAGGTSPLISGLYPGYEGYYNFFNIHAYGTTEAEIYANGLSYAKEWGWNTRYNSIAGGANILGSSYISKGQDTLYLQKFDVDDSYYGLFSHQYMQNLLGAANEGKTAYSVYSGMGILDNSFVFKIPVYENMPVSAVPKPEGNYNTEEIEGFISRLYTNILKRDADEGGMYYWYNLLVTEEKTASQVVELFVFSEEFTKQKVSNEEFVERMYVTMMNRASDSGGKAYWLEYLENGCSRKYVLSKFIESEEFTNICNSYGVKKGSITLTEARDRYTGATKFVNRLYQTTLKRTPDVDGLNYWVEIVGTKASTPYLVAEQIVTSQEFKNYNYSNKDYVEILYVAFMDRKSDAEGSAYWVKQLESGVSREQILKEFANSPEFANIAAAYGL